MVLADNGRGSFSKLITVILQYYLQEYPDLLTPSSRQLIQETVERNGAVDLEKYLLTPLVSGRKTSGWALSQSFILTMTDENLCLQRE